AAIALQSVGGPVRGNRRVDNRWRERCKTRRHLLGRQSRFRPSNELQIPTASLVELTIRTTDDLLGADRHEELWSLADAHPEEAAVGHADDLERMIVERNCFADDVRIVRVSGLPEAFAQ